MRVERTHEELSFWRAYSGTEIDLLIEKDNTIITGYDMKWNDMRKGIILNDTAPIGEVSFITRTNFMQYI